MGMFKDNQWFQHKDGGIYQFLCKVHYSDRPGDEGVLYAHLWPFEEGKWVRPIAEWTEDRFKPIEMVEALEIVDSMTEEEGQAMVKANKAKRKG